MTRASKKFTLFGFKSMASIWEVTFHTLFLEMEQSVSSMERIALWRNKRDQCGPIGCLETRLGSLQQVSIIVTVT